MAASQDALRSVASILQATASEDGHGKRAGQDPRRRTPARTHRPPPGGGPRVAGPRAPMAASQDALRSVASIPQATASEDGHGKRAGQDPRRGAMQRLK